jgi:hypothetical protein
MRRKPSAPSLLSESGPEDSQDFHDYDDGSSSIYMATATSSGNASDAEKESDNGTMNDLSQDVEDDEVTEGTSLLLPSRRANLYGGISIKDDPKDDHLAANSHSVPSVVYASPVKPHLPSPSASNSRVTCLNCFWGDKADRQLRLGCIYLITGAHRRWCHMMFRHILSTVHLVQARR